MQTATVTYVDYVPRGGVGEAQPQTSPQEQQQPQAPGHRPRSSFAQSAYQHADRGSGPENVPSGPDLSAAVARSSAESSSPEPSGDEDGQLAFVLQQQEVADSSMSQEGGARIRTSGLSDGRHLQDDPHLSQQFQTRLSGAQYGKHTPRVNSVDMRQPEDFMTDRELLCHRLEMYGLCERRVKGDGNCQFRALSDQLYQTPHTHKAVRKLVVERLQSHAKLYSAYVPADYEEYCSSMELSGTWGDHITLQALADALGIRVCVLTSFPGSDFIEILPADEKLRTTRSLYVSFWAEVHYNSIYPSNAPPNKVPNSKVLGSRKLHRLFHRAPQP